MLKCSVTINLYKQPKIEEFQNNSNRLPFDSKISRKKVEISAVTFLIEKKKEEQKIRKCNNHSQMQSFKFSLIKTVWNSRILDTPFAVTSWTRNAKWDDWLQKNLFKNARKQVTKQRRVLIINHIYFLIQTWTNCRLFHQNLKINRCIVRLLCNRVSVPWSKALLLYLSLVWELSDLLKRMDTLVARETALLQMFLPLLSIGIHPKRKEFASTFLKR